MTARWLTIFAVATASISGQGSQVFRASADVVVVDVSVSQKDLPVVGLAAKDFELLDDGAPQAIELAASGPIPIDVDLLIDTGSLGTWNPQRFWYDVPRVGNLLRSGDRLSLATFSTAVHREFPLQAVPVNIPLREWPLGGLAVPVDALVQAMLRPGVAGRRHVIIEITGGPGSDVSLPAHVHAVATKCDATVYIVVTGRENPVLTDAAQTTGGRVMSEHDLLTAISGVLNVLDRGYVLIYTATGVPRAGWHDITVKAVNPGAEKYTVRARRGYFRE